MQANQLSTEQRYFGTSVPGNLNMAPDLWKHVTIEQAAKDHHRIVQALEPFYAGTWLNTGHSKGGMTSIFHRRFFPDDVDATIAYVAPISFADPDSRYIPFLDQIGEQPCREAIRNVQRKTLEKIDEILPLAAADAVGMTFNRAGGHASAFEKAVILLEWGFWQSYRPDYCSYFMNAPSDAAGLYQVVSMFVGPGFADSWVDDLVTYDYQAMTQLGKQAFATAHLNGVLRHEATKINYAPAGSTPPPFDPAPMQDIQAWVDTSATKMLFIYGQYDPWTGGAYAVPPRAEMLKVVAPKAPHGAMLTTLTAADRDAALAKIEAWMGTRPTITPTHRPARPLRP
jgi:hypothetical protein